MRIRYGIPVLAVVVAFALTGCVNNSAPSSSGGTVKAGPVDKSAAALLPANIKKSKVIEVGVDATYPPDEYKNDAGNAIGWDIDLFNAAAAKLGVKAKYNIAGFDTIIPGITNGKYDAGVSSFTDNADREKKVDFVNYYTAGIEWASAAGKSVDPDNACGLKVAVETGTVEQLQDVPDRSKACVKAGKKAIQILQFDGQDQATNAVVLGQANAMSADSPITDYAIKQSNGKLQAAGKSFEVAPYGIAVNKGSSLAKALQKSFSDMLTDGTYTKILKKWGVDDGALTAITINAAGNS